MARQMSCPWGSEYYGTIKMPCESRLAYYHLRPELTHHYMKVLDAMHQFKRSVNVDRHLNNQDLFELI